jgi:hypothetical protein
LGIEKRGRLGIKWVYCSKFKSKPITEPAKTKIVGVTGVPYIVHRYIFESKYWKRELQRR